MKRFWVLLLAVCIGFTVSSIALAAEVIPLKVWIGYDVELEWIDGVIGNFKASYPGAEFDISVSIQSELTCKDVILSDIANAADVFTFTDSQLLALYQNNVLQPVGSDLRDVKDRNSKASIAAATVKDVPYAYDLEDILYAFPASVDMGYFLYYNKSYIEEDDVLSIESLLDLAATGNKRVSMNMSDGRSVYAFFSGAGFDLNLNDDGRHDCNWNATDTEIAGIQVAEAMRALANHTGFISRSDAELIADIQNGNIIAGINGLRNTKAISAAWGNDFAAAKLPVFTIADQQVLMASMVSYKLVGVNANSTNVGWAMNFANFMTNEESQLSRFMVCNDAPTNVAALAADAIQASPAVAVLIEQSAYAETPKIAECYWSAASMFGRAISGENEADVDLQALLDKIVEDIDQPGR